MNDFFTKFKHLLLQFKQCEVEKEDDQLILSILSKLGPEYFIFVSTFHTEQHTILNWKMSTLNAFIESLTNEHDKILQMGILISSRDQTLFTEGPKSLNSKGKKKKEKTKFDPPKQKEKKQQLDEPSGSRKKKKKGKENIKFSYYGR